MLDLHLLIRTTHVKNLKTNYTDQFKKKNRKTIKKPCHYDKKIYYSLYIIFTK